MNLFHKVLELWPGHESGTDRRTDGRRDGRLGRTGVTLNALQLFFEYAGAQKISGDITYAAPQKAPKFYDVQKRWLCNIKCQ